MAVLTGIAALGIGAVAFGSGLFGDDEGARDRAQRGPERSASTAPAPEIEEPGEPSSRPSRSASRSASASASTSGGTVTRAGEDRSSRTPIGIGGGISARTSPPPIDGSIPDTRPQGPPTLRLGDSGPEVVELQKRLKQLNLLDLSEADGRYDSKLAAKVRDYQRSRGIDSDPSGIYGGATRSSLEAETREP